MKTQEADWGLTVCPEDRELSRLLDDDASDTTDLEQHIETCLGCQKKLEQLTDDDEVRLPNSKMPPYLSSFASQLARATEASPTVTLPGFEIHECVGRGGMGVVYRARHEQLDREVAVKVIAAGAHAGPEYRERLDREGKLVAKLDHPNIVRIFDSGQHDNLPYLVLEFMDGGSLAERREQLSDPKTIVRLIEILARALHAAHDVGIIHRDLKPGNVLLTETDSDTDAIEIGGQLFIPRIADFGLSKQVLQQEDVSNSTGMLGTPGYMAPEQANESRNEIGAATDIHALGIILYELLAGCRPFDGRTTLATVENVRSQPAEPLRNYRSDVLAELEDICQQCLHKQPSARYSSALELAEELARFQAGQPLQRTQRSHAKRSPKTARRFVAVAAVAMLLFTVFRVQTDRGTIVIDADDSIEIEIRRNDRSVDTFEVTDSNQSRSVYSGDIEIVIPSSASDRYTLSNSRFRMTRDRREVVTIRRIETDHAHMTESAVASAMPALAVGASEREFAEWFVQQRGILRLHDEPRAVKTLEDLPEGDIRIHYVLDQGKMLGDQHLPVIASLADVRMIQISSDEFTGSNLELLNSVANLRYLSLVDCPINDQNFAAFDNYKNLRSLAIPGTQISSSFIPRLTACEKLDELSVTEQQILHPQGIQFLKSIQSLQAIGIYEFTDASAEVLCKLPSMWRLSFFDGRGISQSTMDAVCRTKTLRRLKFWDTDLSNVDFSGLQKLNDLVWLELMNVNLSPKRIASIASLLPNCDIMHSVERDLEAIVLEIGGKTDSHPTTRRKTKHPTHYHDLEIDAITLNNTPLLRDDHFVSYQYLTHLKSLSVNKAGINGSTLNYISHLTSLQNLSLAETRVNDRHIGFLSKLTNLKSLNLHDTEVTAKGIANLAKLKRLETVCLDGLQVTVGTVAVLDQLPELKHLNLRQASNSTIEQIAELEQLETLSIEESYTVTEQCLSALSTLQNLTTLTLGTTNIQPSSLEQLSVLLPDCNVVKKPIP